ncbi:hypothetical protein K443DRAFT_9054 [Laccaria amethystina LaAM-08-1]|uniref:Uncharacterized protein n=1 Tax=Laccaria amethystina LaAM-08-1 TaxID=1095629 RepID=A0A0C9XAX8_9AGAR|nr:hypothetical protein K443DRAFT_9054 [Laccaria amethystina LaAM-08-1]
MKILGDNTIPDTPYRRSGSVDIFHSRSTKRRVHTVLAKAFSSSRNTKIGTMTTKKTNLRKALLLFLYPSRHPTSASENRTHSPYRPLPAQHTNSARTTPASSPRTATPLHPPFFQLQRKHPTAISAFSYFFRLFRPNNCPPTFFCSTITCLTYLRPTLSHSSLGLGALPPSPPIHRERERRCLRKSRQPGVGGNTIEMDLLTRVRNIEELERKRDVLPDGDENEGEDVVMHSTPPPASHHQPGSASNSPASPGSPGSGTTLFSRIGSVKRWGVMRRRGRVSSSTPSEVITIGRSDFEANYQQQDAVMMDITPRHHGGRHSPTPHHIPTKVKRHSGATTSSVSASTNVQRPQNKASGSSQQHQNWLFFRSLSATQSHSTAVSGSPASPTASTRPHSRLESSGAGACSRSTSTSDLPGTYTTSPATNVVFDLRHTPTLPNGRNALQSIPSSPPHSPAKLVKRKSSGFAPLKLGFGGHGH